MRIEAYLFLYKWIWMEGKRRAKKNEILENNFFGSEMTINS
jgi:hypothetical protein